MTIPPAEQPTRRIHPRLLAILAGLFVLICITVIAADLLNMRKSKAISAPASNPGASQ